jgi:hypothetical protein
MLSSSRHCPSVEGKTPFAMTTINFPHRFCRLPNFDATNKLLKNANASGLAGRYACQTFDFSSKTKRRPAMPGSRDGRGGRP